MSKKERPHLYLVGGKRSEASRRLEAGLNGMAAHLKTPEGRAMWRQACEEQEAEELANRCPVMTVWPVND